MREEKKISPLRSPGGLRRRDFFSQFCDGVHGAALAWLLGHELHPASTLFALPSQEHRMPDLRPRPPHFSPKARAVIHLFMNGGPSQVDLFDPKPMLKKYEGQPPSRELANDIEFIEQAGGMM